jgi:polyphosphate kinase 2 (PPK2 family)
VPVDTWRDNYPYDERMSRHEYEIQKRSQRTGARHMILFEGRDADFAPWIALKSNDKCGYDDKDDEVVGQPDPLIVGRALTD